MPLTPSEMSVEDLLHALAFCRGQYTAETVAGMEIALAAKGCRQRHIRSWREQFLLVRSAETSCEKCGRELILDEDELISGLFDCPRCRHTQEVHYRELKQMAFRVDLPDYLAELTDGSGRPGEMPNEELLKTFALEGYRFKPGIKDHLKRLFVVRGYRRADIRAWREKNIPDESAETRCRICRTKLTLTRKDLIEGEFTCPDCRKTQAVHYLRLPSFDQRAKPSVPEENPPGVELSAQEIDRLSDTALLEALALRASDYSPATREMMMRRLRSRGYVPDDVQAWRDGRSLSKDIPDDAIPRFKPGGALGGLLAGLFIFITALDALLITVLGFGSHIPGVMGKPLFSGGQAVLAADPAAAVILIGVFCAEILASVLFLFWFYRVYRNVTALTSRPTAIRPWIAIVLVIIPITGFIVPYLMAKEIMRSNLPADPARPGSNPVVSTALVKWWWGSYLVMIGFNIFMTDLVHRVWPHQTSWAFLASIGINLLAAAYAGRLVYNIDRRQSALFAAQHGAPLV